jgi:hypothetical protein
MTREQTAGVVAMIRVLWPHSQLGGDPAAVLGVWHAMLGDLDVNDAEAAVRELAAQGREHAPPAGVVVKTAAERATEAPEWDEARAEILTAVRRYRPSRDEAMRDPYAPPPDSYWSSPLLAQFMDGAWNEWRAAAEGDGTFNAQHREAWKALAARAGRRAALSVVGAPRRRDLERPENLTLIFAPPKDAA